MKNDAKQLFLKSSWCVKSKDGSELDINKLKDMMCVANQQAALVMVDLIKRYNIENVEVGTMEVEDVRI